MSFKSVLLCPVLMIQIVKHLMGVTRNLRATYMNEKTMAGGEWVESITEKLRATRNG